MHVDKQCSSPLRKDLLGRGFSLGGGGGVLLQKNGAWQCFGVGKVFICLFLKNVSFYKGQN